MCWRLALLSLLAGILGCHHSQNRVDPVFGRQVIPPPGTGTAGTAVLPSNEPPPASYYEGGSQLPRTSSTGSPTADPYSPPGGSYEYGGNATARSNMTSDQGFRPPNVGATGATATTTSTSRAAGVPLKATGPDDASRRYESTDTSTGFYPNTNTSVGGSAPATNTKLPTPPPTTNNQVQPQSAPAAAPATNSGSSSQPAPYPTTGSLPPRSASLASGSAEPVAFREPRRLTPDDSARAIGEVSDARTFRDDDYDQSSSSGTLRTASYQRWEGEQGSETRTATATQPAFVPGGSKTATRRMTSGPYGYDEENYQWLKGKLEYSLAQKQWKLRYIPISDPMDEFGGSVVLEDIDALGDTFRPGDYVTVEGTLAEVEESPGNFAPRYTIKSIERTGNN